MKVLIVDDKPENLYLVESILKAYGYEIISAHNGAEALGFANKEKPDLIIADILMPVMDGYTLCRECKKDIRLQKIPFIFYTATYTDPKDEDFALSLGADRFILKPQEPDVFIKIIDECLEEINKDKNKKQTATELPENVILKEYNQTLIRKLEDKMRQTEESEKKLKRYVKELEDSLDNLKRTERALRESEEKYRLVLEHSMDAILFTSPDGSIHSANKAACQMFQMSEEEICTLGRNGIVDMTDERIKALLEERKTKGKAKGELTFIRKDGSKFPAEISSVVFIDSCNELRSSMIIRDITERKNAEKIILLNEQQLSSIYNTVEDIIFYLAVEPNNQYRFISVNPAFVRVTGIPSEQIIGKTVGEIVLQNTLGVDKSNYQLSIKEKRLVRWEETSDYPAGRITGEVSIRPVFDNAGVCTHIVGSIHDITERKLFEDAIRNSEEKFRTTFEYASVGMFLTSLDGKILLANNAVSAMLGYSKEGLIDKRFVEFTYKDDIDVSIDWLNKMKSGVMRTHQFEKRYVHKSGHLIYADVSIALIKDSNGNPLFFVAHLVDITKRKQTENALLLEQQLMHSLMDNSLDFIYFKDTSSRFIRLNKEQAVRFGLNNPDEAIGKTDFDFFTSQHADRAFQDEQAIMKSGKGVIGLEEQETWPDGSVTWVSTTKLPLKDKYGTIIGTFGISRDVTERRHAEETLHEHDIRLRKLASQVPGMIFQFMKKTDGTFCLPYSSDGIYDIFGCLPDEVCNDFTPLTKVIIPKDLNKVIKSIENSAKQLKPWSCEFRIQIPGKEIQWLLGQSIPEKQMDGSILWHGFATDITERKLAEEKTDQLAAIVESSDDAIIGKTLDGIIISWNLGAEKTFGYSEEEIVGKSIATLFPAENISELDQIMEKIKNGEHINHFESIRKRKDGTLINVSLTISPIKDFEGNIIAASTITRDITEKKELENKMKLLAHSLESVSECVSITDKNDTILFVNESFIKTYGYTESELIGKRINIVRPQESMKIGNFSGILDGTLKGGWKGELINQKKDGSLFPIALSTSIIRGPDDEPLALIGVSTDITEMKKAREELIQAKERAEKSDRLKTEFLAQMSHEIRTPINVITNSIDFLKEDLGNHISTEANELFDVIEISSQRIVRTIELILNMSELQTGNFSVNMVLLNLDSMVLSKIYRDYQRAAKMKSLEFVYENKVDDVIVSADEYSLTQIFANLVDNAIKFTKSGSVRITLLRNMNAEIEVCVEDTGIGIGEEFLPNIFEPFTQEEHGYSRSYDGNGLGLTLVKNYCELNNAIVKVKSKKGIGSQFIVTFKK